MNLRDWLIVIGAVIIVGILIDGFRRMRLANKDSLKMSRDMGGNLENTPVDDDYNPELPSGGARVVQHEVMQNEKINEGSLSTLSEVDGLDSGRDQEKIEPVISAQDNFQADLLSNEESEKIVADKHSRIEIESVEVSTAHAGKKTKVAEIQTNNEEKHALVLVINVHAVTNKGFAGNDIKKLLEACGLEHGEMSIFHRHEEDDLLSPIQFSVANAIEPGYFDPETLDQLSTPGVSFFMTLPGPKDYSKAFEYMLETAQCFAKNLSGELKDEHLSVMTPQTIEHCRQQIKEFERQQLSRVRA